MNDSFGRQITYLRISITDRCNLRCVYCMPPEGVSLMRHEDLMSFEEITEVARTSVDMGITKLRVTGGEPLLRRGVCSLIQMLSAIPGVEDLAITTNGILLTDYAEELASCGLRRVNVSLDATDAERYREITRGGDVEQVFRGVEAALRAGLLPVKLNCVVERTSLESDAQDVARYAREIGGEVRFITRMHAESGYFSTVEGGTGGDCLICNRLRLSSTGVIRPCLFSNLAFDTRELGARRALELAIENKPECGGPVSNNSVRALGG